MKCGQSKVGAFSDQMIEMIALFVNACLAGYPFFKTDTVISLDYASFRGFKGSDGVTRFFNIPYAAPPVGSLRFMPPQKVQNMTAQGVLDSRTPGHSCMVNTRELLNFYSNPSEDCLNLNIFMPNAAKMGGNLPVLVYVYGGRFTGGNGVMPYSRGARNIIRMHPNFIVVTINYRLGAFGFLATPEMANAGLLNNGVKDTEFAFQWIRKYIHYFGGDRHQVTGAGLSAGASRIKLT